MYFVHVYVHLRACECRTSVCLLLDAYRIPHRGMCRLVGVGVGFVALVGFLVAACFFKRLTKYAYTCVPIYQRLLRWVLSLALFPALASPSPCVTLGVRIAWAGCLDGNGQ